MNPLASVIGIKDQLTFIWVPFSLKTLILVGVGGTEKRIHSLNYRMHEHSLYLPSSSVKNSVWFDSITCPRSLNALTVAT